VYVRFKTVKHIEIRGKMRQFQPGDWLEVSDQQARVWLADGSAEQLEYPSEWLTDETGIIIQGDLDKANHWMAPWLKSLEIVQGPPELLWPHTIVWDTTVPLHAHMVPCGIYQLRTWQIAVPLASYDTLARDKGDEEDKSLTEKVVGDLRVPLYDTRLMFVRKEKKTEQLFERWHNERGDRQMAFLRALYQSCPLILPLPVSWIDPKYDKRFGA